MAAVTKSQVESAIKKLVKRGFINTPDYWTANYTKLQWIDNLLVQSEAKVGTYTGSDDKMVSITTAINNLVELGAINTPDYWKVHYKDVKYLDILIKRLGFKGKDKPKPLPIAKAQKAITYEQFDRQYRFAASIGGQKGFEIGEITESNPEPLNLEFSFEKTDLSTQNTGQISVWNLSKEHVALLGRENCLVSFRAGYGTNLPLIFAGQVSFSSTDMDGADRKTEIEVVDNMIEMRNTYVKLSYRSAVSWYTIFEDTSKQIGVALVFADNIKSTDLPTMGRGYSFSGRAKNVIQAGCDACGLSWSVQNGVLQICKKGEAMSNRGFVLNASSGLIGIPVQVSISNYQDTGKTVKGWDVQYLMNGAINIDDVVKLESATVSGSFRVYSIQYSGSMTGDWLCKARLLSLKT